MYKNTVLLLEMLYIDVGEWMKFFWSVVTELVLWRTYHVGIFWSFFFSNKQQLRHHKKKKEKNMHVLSLCVFFDDHFTELMLFTHQGTKRDKVVICSP